MDLTFSIDYKLKLVESHTEIKRLIIEELEKKIRPRLQKIKNIIDVELKTIFHNAIVNSPEYKSLKGEKNMTGDESLMGHFGFDDGGNKVDAIVNKWVEGLHSEIFLMKSSGKLSAGIQIYGVSASYADVLGMPEAWQNIGKSNEIGGISSLPWLNILLLDGQKAVLITKHTITFHPKKLDFSRSKQAIMIKSKTKRWFITEPFAGTASDNWILRVLKQDIYPKMQETIKNTVIGMF